MIFEQIEEKLERLFASRLKNVSEASKTVWANEIIAKRFTDEVIDETIREMIEDDNAPMTLSTFFRIAKGKMPLINRKRVDCPYCEGRGYVLGIKFDKNGKYIEGADYGLNCVCGNAHVNGLAFMNEDLSTNHRTSTKDGGYILVFPSIVEKFAYVDKVYANNGFDLGRKDDNQGIN